MAAAQGGKGGSEESAWRRYHGCKIARSAPASAMLSLLSAAYTMQHRACFSSTAYNTAYRMRRLTPLPLAAQRSWRVARRNEAAAAVATCVASALMLAASGACAAKIWRRGRGGEKGMAEEKMRKWHEMGKIKWLSAARRGGIAEASKILARGGGA